MDKSFEQSKSPERELEWHEIYRLFIRMDTPSEKFAEEGVRIEERSEDLFRSDGQFHYGVDIFLTLVKDGKKLLMTGRSVDASNAGGQPEEVKILESDFTPKEIRDMMESLFGSNWAWP